MDGSMAEFILICAVDNNLGLGKNGDLPWKDDPNTKWDMKHFKETTTGYPIIMGYNTYKSLNKPLPKRINYVVNTHSLTEEDESKGIKENEPLDENKFVFVDGFRKACKTAMDYANNKSIDKIFIIGGASIYEKALRDNIISKAIITHFTENYEADTFLQMRNLNSFKQKIVEEHNNGKIVEYSRF